MTCYFIFLAGFYTEECIWCLLTGGVFAKTFNPLISLHSFSCVKPITNTTSFNLNNFTISALENCTDSSILMTQPLISTPIFCDSNFYNSLLEVNQTLTADRIAYTRDFIGNDNLYILILIIQDQE